MAGGKGRLVRYEDHSSVPVLREIAAEGGIATALAMNVLIDWRDPEVAAIGRKLLAHRDPGDQLVGIRAVGLTGDASDLPALRAMEKNDTTMGSGNRGFGLMPAISIAHAARTAIRNIGQRAAK
ncbi:MAG: hypothetical protein KGN84_13715 [Acidobacteriota bacterium]|nr:hypothetical protein [Acidobacteriota bacterium]